MLEAYHKRRPKSTTIADLKETQHMICNSLSQEPIDEAIKSFQSQRLNSCFAWAAFE